MEEKASNLLKEGAARLGFLLTEEKIKAFDLYLKEINSWGKHMNLIRRKDDREIVLKDFLDSLTVARYLPFGASLADLGSGAGFPGVPVKILREDMIVCLLESKQKKVFFLKNLVRVLGLTGIEVHWAKKRNEQEVEGRGEFDFVVCRAFGSLRKFSFTGGPLLKKGGILLAMKGGKGEEEFGEILPLLERMGWEQAFVEKIRLPFLNHGRILIGLRKK